MEGRRLVGDGEVGSREGHAQWVCGTGLQGMCGLKHKLCSDRRDKVTGDKLRLERQRWDVGRPQNLTWDVCQNIHVLQTFHSVKFWDNKSSVINKPGISALVYCLNIIVPNIRNYSSKLNLTGKPPAWKSEAWLKMTLLLSVNIVNVSSRSLTSSIQHEVHFLIPDS